MAVHTILVSSFVLLFSFCSQTEGQDCPYPEYRCKWNEVFTMCYQPYCEKTCQNPEIVEGCSLDRCYPGCKCREGFVRDENNLCIPLHQCNRDGCCLNEYYGNCGICEAQCRNLENKACALICDPPACLCRSGYARNDFGQCIPIDNCKLIRPRPCRKNEVKACKWCEATCGNPEPRCPLGECSWGCFCRDGYLRNCFGECIPKEQCDYEINYE